MRTFRLAVLIALVAGVTLGAGVSGAFASAKGKVTAERAGDSPYSLSFNAGGTPTRGHGYVIYEQAPEEGEYSFIGRVTCYYQEAGPFGGNRAVFTGPVVKETRGFNSEAFAVLVSDGASNLGRDAFNLFTGPPGASDCSQNFGFDVFDQPFPPPRGLYLVTSGDIVIR